MRAVGSKADEVETNIILWLSPLNFWVTQDDTISRREAGTCQWIFKEAAFTKWLDGTERTIWCPGIPGAGKTILSSAVVDHLRNRFPDDDIGIAFIYCNYKEQEQQTVVNLTASLLAQLLLRRPLPAKLHALYQERKRTNTRPSSVECLELLRTELSHFSRAFLIVDALDECNDNNGTRSALIQGLLNLPTTTSLMITSRHVPSIEEQLKQACHLEIRATDKDVRIFLERQIQTKYRLQKHIRREPSLMQDIFESVVKAAQGMFLLAQLHMDAISQKQRPKDVRTALTRLPKELDETYAEAMKRIRGQNEEDSELAQCVLTWITFALRPLTVTEIRHAIAVEPDQTSIEEDDLVDEDIIVSVCAGLVVIDQESKVIRLIHYTTQEYFDRNRQTEFSDGQSKITKSCLTYLSFKEFESGYCSDDDQMQARLQQNPLFLYAAQNWGNHAHGAAENMLQIQILQFLAGKSQLSSMVQAMQLPQFRSRGYSQRPPRIIFGLWVAAILGLSFTAAILIEENVDLNQQTDHREMAIFGAAWAGHEAVVQLLLDEGADVETKDKYGRTALYIAAQEGHEAVVRRLLDKGADVETKDDDGRTVLHEATKKGYKAIVLLLLKKGADVKTKSKSGRTALYEAAQEGYEAIVQLLLDEGADVETKYKDEYTGLYTAAQEGHEAVVRLLLDKGADVETKDDNGHTVLHEATKKGYEAVVLLLLKKGADVKTKSKSGRTALHEAAQEGHEAVVRLLLDKGADVETKDEYRHTALYKAAWKGHEAIVRLLLEKGADIKIKSKSGRTALHEAAWKGHEAVIRLLLEKGADVETKDEYGCTALYEAAWKAREAIVRLLLDKGADVKTKDENGSTALHEAAREGHEVIIRLLLEKGADVEAKDSSGSTALQVAALEGHEAVVRLLTPLALDS